jgi:hypothetical protein
MRSLRIALVVSAIALAIALVALLSRSPPVVAGSNGVPDTGHAELDLGRGDTSTCQPVGTVPQGTSAIRVSIGAGAGPKVRMQVLSEGHIATQGELPAGWGLEAAADVPVEPLRHELHNALVCVGLGPNTGPLDALGLPRQDPSEHTLLSEIDLRVEFLRHGSNSWWSLASSTAHRFGLGRAVSGTWLAFLALLLMISAGALSLRLLLRELR